MSRNTRTSQSREKDAGKDMSEADIWNCEGCNKEFRDPQSKILECERCEKHYCAKCVKMSDTEYEVLTSRNDIHWFCNLCDKKVMQCIQIEKDVEQKLANFTSVMETKLKDLDEKWEKQMLENVRKIKDDTDSRITKMEKEMKILNGHVVKANDELNSMKGVVDKQISVNNQDIKELSSKVTDIIDGNDGNWCEVVKKQVDKSLERVSGSVIEVNKTVAEARAKAAEERDKEGRRNNIVIFRVPESSATTAADRNAEDQTFCLQLFNNGLHCGTTEEDFVKVFRLGRIQESENPRPLMVQLASYSTKNLIMESLYKLKHAQQKFKGIIVNHDMTQNEREDYKKLVAEAKSLADQDTSGEYMYRVRGRPAQMRVVKIKLRQ